LTEFNGIAETQLRRWLSLLRRPDQLSGPDVVELLAAHGRLPSSTSSNAIGHAAATLLVDTIEQLRAPDEAPKEQHLPHAVLKTCFIDGAKLFQAAGVLGLSERQMTRERSRAIALLKGELEAALKTPPFRGEPIPTIRGFLPRPGQTHALQAVLEQARHANVFGPMGIGKTSLGAEVAAEVARSTPVIWYRMRPQVNTTLIAMLFELGERMKQEGAPELSAFLNESLSTVDTALATRVALRTLAVGPILIVLDDYHHAESDPAIAGFLEEVVSRLPQIRLVTISRYRYAGTSGEAFEVPPFSRRETSEFLKQLGVDCQPAMAKTIHTWTGGTPNLIKLAASWLKTASPEEIARGVRSLNEQEEVQSFLLSYTTQLLGPDDREVLEAASIFRDRFSDEGLAFVSERTRGEIVDASLRLSRVYVATRSREGDTAFFHTSVRDYVYARIEAIRRNHLHDRAATWYRRAGREEEADYHQHRAEIALDDLDYSA
jgi:ATP/maltotriose-dependent transcriptional regulator MalT